MRDEIQNSQVPPSIVVQEWAKTIKNKSDTRCPELLNKKGFRL